MKKLLYMVVLALFIFSSCEVEYRDGVAYHHSHGWHHRTYPEHHDVYDHGWHHDREGGEIIVH